MVAKNQENSHGSVSSPETLEHLAAESPSNAGELMPIFTLTLQPTYYKQGFFNVVVDFDLYVRTKEGPVRLKLGRAGKEIEGRINRYVNRNGTARILGGVKLRDWFQANFKPMDSVAVDLGSSELIVLEKPRNG
jgi:hypothetical protein